MNKVMGLILCSVAALLLNGCSIKYGQPPATHRLNQELERQVSTKGDVLRVLGAPRGYGMGSLSGLTSDRTIWFYEFTSANALTAKIDFKFLLIFFEGEKFDGHLWFSTLGMRRRSRNESDDASGNMSARWQPIHWLIVGLGAGCFLPRNPMPLESTMPVAEVVAVLPIQAGEVRITIHGETEEKHDVLIREFTKDQQSAAGTAKMVFDSLAGSSKSPISGPSKVAEQLTPRHWENLWVYLMILEHWMRTGKKRGSPRSQTVLKRSDV